MSAWPINGASGFGKYSAGGEPFRRGLPSRFWRSAGEFFFPGKARKRCKDGEFYHFPEK